MRRSIALLLLLAWAGLATAGDDLATGLAAYERGDYRTALAAWLPLAERGDAEAQYRVGRLYYYGTGVKQDLLEAARWYRAAAEQGHARSQSNLGALYDEGRGIPADPAAAAAWYAKAAAQGRAVACNNLGRMYEQGRGVAQDERKAAELYEVAARQGYAEAQWRLARMYEQGRGVAADPKQARKWDSRATKNGYSPGKLKGASAAVGAGVASSIATTPQAPAGETATEAGGLRSAAEAGDAEAQFRLGTLYRLGEGVPSDPIEAAIWYRRAAQQGHGMATYMLGYLYYRGRVDEDRDLVQAYVWFARAEELGVGDAGDWVERIESRMTSKQRAEAQRLAAEREPDEEEKQ